jgi:hypothetical protein
VTEPVQYVDSLGREVPIRLANSARDTPERATSARTCSATVSRSRCVASRRARSTALRSSGPTP